MTDMKNDVYFWIGVLVFLVSGIATFIPDPIDLVTFGFPIIEFLIAIVSYIFVNKVK